MNSMSAARAAQLVRRACSRYDSPLEPRWELKFSACLPPFILLRPRFLSAPQVSINQHGKQQGGATMCLPRMNWSRVG